MHLTTGTFYTRSRNATGFTLGGRTIRVGRPADYKYLGSQFDSFVLPTKPGEIIPEPATLESCYLLGVASLGMNALITGAGGALPGMANIGVGAAGMANMAGMMGGMGMGMLPPGTRTRNLACVKRPPHLNEVH